MDKQTRDKLPYRCDLHGVRSGMLVAVEYVGGSKWLCQCDCGNQNTVVTSEIKKGTTKSCGCSSKKIRAESRKTHGMTNHPLYAIWKNIHSRCYNKKDRAYPDYGGRGIRVCKRWHNIHNFIADMVIRPDRKSLDRINNDGDYKPSNCQWATPTQQQRNTRRNRMIAYKGKQKPLSEWSEITGINYSTLKGRLDTGWSLERAFNEPTR